jgi:hypothetical protein
MTFKKLSAVAIAALTTLALTACGGDTEADEAAPTDVPSFDRVVDDCAVSPLAETPTGSGKWAPSAEWSPTVDGDEVTWNGWYEISQIGVSMDVACHGVYDDEWQFVDVDIEDPSVSFSDLDDDQIEAIRIAYGDSAVPDDFLNLNQVCFGDRDPRSDQELDGARVMCPMSMHLPAENHDEPEPTTSSSPRPAPSGSGMMDEIYAQMMRDEGIEVSNGEFAQLSASVCDTFDNQGSQADALGVIQDATGETGWRGTRILQAAVVNKCSQHVDYTY